MSGVVFAEKMYQEQSSLQSLMDTLRTEPLKNQNDLEFNNKQKLSVLSTKSVKVRLAWGLDSNLLCVC